MPPSNTVHIGELYVPTTEKRIGDFDCLYEHQIRAIESKSNVVVLDAPTGSGKTLAALARVMHRSTPAVFIYPTNALVKDQVEKIKSDLVKLGYSPNLIDEKYPQSSFERLGDGPIVDLIHATGETLEKIADERAKGSVLERILAETDKQGGMRIILTNPDVLYLVNSGMYHRHGLISEQLFKFRAVVVDEFHLYSGPTLARLFFMLNEMRGSSKPQIDLVFLSATHGDILDLLRSTYPNLDLVRASTQVIEGPRLKKIRYCTSGEVRSQSSILTDEDAAGEIATEIVKLYDSEYEWTDSGPKVKVLGIFSSVTFAALLAKKVKAILQPRGIDPDVAVKQIHGLIPRSARESINDFSEAILIGTSAIEVGVDFDVPFLIMEAHDLASFLQRFGRGGRHAPCKFILYVPTEMALRLEASKEFTFPALVEEAEEAFHELPSYSRFICSQQARTILLAMARAGSKTYDNYSRREDTDIKAAIQYYKALVDANQQVSVGDQDLKDKLGTLSDEDIEFELIRFPVEVMAKSSFARGAMNNILVRYPAHLLGMRGSYFFAEIDIFDAFRMAGNIDTAEAHWMDLPKPLKRRYGRDSAILIATDFTKQLLPKALIDQNASARFRASVFMRNQTTLRTPDPRMTDVINRLLEKRNLVFFWRGMNRGVDYRIPRIYAEEENGALVIGDWALVAEYLYQEMIQEDQMR